MIVSCDKCRARFDDEYRLTVCPHHTFAANDGNNNFSHHPESYIMEVDPLFQFHKLNEQGIARAEIIAETFSVCLYQLAKQCPTNTREFSIVKTKLEEACFFAKKSMANESGNQQQ